MSDYENYLKQLQTELPLSPLNDMTLDERITEYIEWQNTEFDKRLMVDAHLEIISLRAENARLKQQLQAESTAYYLLRDERDSFIVKLAAAEKIFNHFGGLSELMKWENGQGETAANVVQEYLEL
jgi:hypothetical protein